MCFLPPLRPLFIVRYNSAVRDSVLPHLVTPTKSGPSLRVWRQYSDYRNAGVAAERAIAAIGGSGNAIGATGFNWLAASGSGSSDEEEALYGYPRGSGGLSMGASSQRAEQQQQQSELNRVATAGGLPRQGDDSPSGHSGRIRSRPMPTIVAPDSGSSARADGGTASGERSRDIRGRVEPRARVGGGRAASGGAGERGQAWVSQALEMEVLQATVAATVAAVAQETLTDSMCSGFSDSASSSNINSGGGGSGGGRKNSSNQSNASTAGTTGTNGDGRAEIALPLAGSRSPAARSLARPTLREVDSRSDDGDDHAGVRDRRHRPPLGGASSSDNSSEGGFEGSLPLAGGRSPLSSSPIIPGRYEPDSFGMESLDGSQKGSSKTGVAENDVDKYSDIDDDGNNNERFVGSLPLASSRSPPRAPTPLPGRRELDSVSDNDENVISNQEKGAVPVCSAQQQAPFSSPRVTVSPRHDQPRRDKTRRGDGPESYCMRSTRHQASLSPTHMMVSPRRDRPRGDRTRRGDDPEHHPRAAAAAATTAPRARRSFSEASSPPLDLLSLLSGSLSGGRSGGASQKAPAQRRSGGSGSSGGGGGGAVENISVTRDRTSFSSCYETADFDFSGPDSVVRRGEGRKTALGEVAEGTKTAHPPLTSAGRIASRKREKRASRRTNQHQSARHVASYIVKTTMGRSRQQGKDGRWVAGKAVGARVVAPAAAEAAVGESDEGVCGLRSTHFAPGYLGVAWPDPVDSKAATRASAEAQARILMKLERAAAKKLRELEERTRRTRQEMTDRRKRRCVCLSAWIRVFVELWLGGQGQRNGGHWYMFPPLCT